jgi:hypothetical protein
MTPEPGRAEVEAAIDWAERLVAQGQANHGSGQRDLVILAAEVTRLRDGLSALVHCQSPLSRAAMREAANEILAGKTTPMQDQSPFVSTITSLRAEVERLTKLLADPCPDGQFSNPNLPDGVVYAGIAAKEKADHDLENYVSGETIDWDTGMICVAIFRAMLSAAEPPL